MWQFAPAHGMIKLFETSALELCFARRRKLINAKEVHDLLGD
jgi:hypothetical protein